MGNSFETVERFYLHICESSNLGRISRLGPDIQSTSSGDIQLCFTLKYWGKY